MAARRSQKAFLAARPAFPGSEGRAERVESRRAPLPWRAGRAANWGSLRKSELGRPGEVIKHGDLKCIFNEGMPVYKNPLEKGSLIIQFLVAFPEKNWLPQEWLPLLKALSLPWKTSWSQTTWIRLTSWISTPRNCLTIGTYEEDEEGPRTGVQCQTS
ncbi:dnaJ homolog subfamily A member 4-like [Paroedura picta]|uniref:dnaJ homolog subfamily A member 4-like n=1 Tax=Paroedura picta TaxID=143630 RepID=UPI004055AEA6